MKGLATYMGGEKIKINKNAQVLIIKLNEYSQSEHACVTLPTTRRTTLSAHWKPPMASPYRPLPQR